MANFPESVTKPPENAAEPPESAAIPPKKKPKYKPKYKPFTDADANQVDLPELLTNMKYQLDIEETYGMDVLTAGRITKGSKKRTHWLY